MVFKTLVSSFTTLDLFVKDPLKALSLSKEEALAILKNDIPVMYVVTPNLLKKLFAMTAHFKKNNFYLSEIKPLPQKIKAKQNYSNTKLQNGKFLMHHKWKPDCDFVRQASLWGINLTHSVEKEELVSFIDYWKAEGRFFYHIQWQQKLARNLEQRRSSKIIRNNRDINKISIPDNTIPDGFRDK
ncbi:primosomal protein 1 [Buchnera aphidicola (Nipponaphis monzeni)]|uniref:Primosomal protein 1 n=1 Tax=Buchnera aphidicola (Nipponaphis monzeni) TaxID=2495405 RepID=A0A455T9N7_9GAMM|nr:primosomal protein DnaT [Buchnera aphidicola]BBI01039.1 primosomal protein 1 [Buchnera aphidicola (Nipponaphis monzeni)]